MGFNCTDKEAVRDRFVHSRVLIPWAGDGHERWFESRDGGLGCIERPASPNLPFFACMHDVRSQIVMN